MIENVKINSFKCLSGEDLTFRPFTIIPGENSSGKSTLIQSVLLYMRLFTQNGERLLSDVLPLDFSSLRNKYTKSDSVDVEIDVGGEKYNYEFCEDGIIWLSFVLLYLINYVENICYLKDIVRSMISH